MELAQDWPGSKNLAPRKGQGLCTSSPNFPDLDCIGRSKCLYPLLAYKLCIPQSLTQVLGCWVVVELGKRLRRSQASLGRHLTHS